MRRDATALVYVESRMHPTAQHARSINGQQSSLNQERNHARTEQLLQRRVITGEMRVCRATLFLSEVASEVASAHHMKLSIAIKQSIRHQRVQVRMKVEIFAEGVDRHDDGWNAIVRCVANAACVAERITQNFIAQFCNYFDPSRYCLHGQLCSDFRRVGQPKCALRKSPII